MSIRNIRSPLASPARNKIRYYIVLHYSRSKYCSDKPISPKLDLQIPSHNMAIFKAVFILNNVSLSVSRCYFVLAK